MMDAISKPDSAWLLLIEQFCYPGRRSENSDKPCGCIVAAMRTGK
jgi:hypothetical protein